MLSVLQQPHRQPVGRVLGFKTNTKKTLRSTVKILVVDDHPLILEALHHVLKQLDADVMVFDAQSADQAQALLREHPDADLLLLDLGLPGADGLEVLKFAVRTNPDMAVIILTAYGTLDTTLEAIKEGAYDYLTKPFKTQEITILAERAFQRAQLIDDNRELKKNLRDTYRDLKLLRNITESNNPDVTTGWLERIEKLKTMNVLLATEAETLKDRLVKGYTKDQDVSSG